jgi:23S rRNA (cytidine1920-2'-O)/16S rRNA (cytidine1409-2'-O)-methyltransferase
VTVAGAPATKPSRLVGIDEPVQVIAPSRFVSRGGEKLAAALERFDLDVEGRHALDVGASTGGFTDCLLRAGVARVTAVDVGHGQLHPRLRSDPRVEVRERMHARELRAGAFDRRPEVVVADLSFISLRRALPWIVPVAAPGADVVLLVKPQFEAGRVEASRGRGVVRDRATWRRVLGEVIAVLESLEAAAVGAVPSSLRGANGNVEFFVHARTADHSGPPAGNRIDLDAVVDAVERREQQ